MSNDIFFEIYLDGTSIYQYVSEGSISISQNQNSVHNEISISSISTDLFAMSDPLLFQGTPRIEVRIGTRILFFLLEERQGDAFTGKLTLWGRDQTAKDSAPWSNPESYFLEEGQSAQEFVLSKVKNSSVSWELLDWTLPKGYEISGTPTEIFQKISQEIGGIIRAQDDGSFLLKRRTTPAPIDLPTAVPELEYQDNQIQSFSYDEKVGSHYNLVSVVHDADTIQLPQIELEESLESSIGGTSRIIGEDSFVRVYWEREDSSFNMSYVTDGEIIKQIGPNLNSRFQEEKEEIITFEKGIGTTSYPILDLKSIVWIGDSAELEGIGFVQYNKEIMLTDSSSYRLATVIYDTEYDKFILQKHNVEILLAVFYFLDSPSVNVAIETPPIIEDKEGTAINTSAITTQAAAVELGLSWIRQNKYNYQTRSFESPFDSNLIDGKVIWLDSEKVQSNGNYYVLSADINIQGVKISNSLEVIRWIV